MSQLLLIALFFGSLFSSALEAKSSYRKCCCHYSNDCDDDDNSDSDDDADSSCSKKSRHWGSKHRRLKHKSWHHDEWEHPHHPSNHGHHVDPSHGHHHHGKKSCERSCDDSSSCKHKERRSWRKRTLKHKSWHHNEWEHPHHPHGSSHIPGHLSSHVHSDPSYGSYSKEEYAEQFYSISPDFHGSEIPVDPVVRAYDFVEAFQRMKEMDPKGRYYAIVDGQSVDGLADVQLMRGSSLLLLTIERGSRVEQRVVAIEDLDRVGRRGPMGHFPPIRLPKSWSRDE